MDSDVESVADILNDFEKVQTNVVDDHDQVVNVKAHKEKDFTPNAGFHESPKYSDPF